MNTQHPCFLLRIQNCNRTLNLFREAGRRRRVAAGRVPTGAPARDCLLVLTERLGQQEQNVPGGGQPRKRSATIFEGFCPPAGQTPAGPGQGWCLAADAGARSRCRDCREPSATQRKREELPLVPRRGQTERRGSPQDRKIPRLCEEGKRTHVTTPKDHSRPCQSTPLHQQGHRNQARESLPCPCHRNPHLELQPHPASPPLNAAGCEQNLSRAPPGTAVSAAGSRPAGLAPEPPQGFSLTTKGPATSYSAKCADRTRRVGLVLFRRFLKHADTPRPQHTVPGIHT
nr:uncharacterized protein LOC105873503 [Microcebus murinus]